MNIVIADDEQIILKWMKKNIEAISPEYHVIGMYTNGKQALECCEAKKAEVLFTDIRMPIMDGMEVLKKLAEYKIMPYTVILSAYDEFNYARECFKLGAKEFLLKSEITKEELKKCLNAAEKMISASNSDKEEKFGEEDVRKILKKLESEKTYTSDFQFETYLCENMKMDREAALAILFCNEGIINDKLVKELLSYFFFEEGTQEYYIKKDEKQIVVFFSAQRVKTENLAKKLYEILLSFGYRKISVNVSRVGNIFQNLQDIYYSAKEVLQYQQFYEQVSGLTFDEKIKKQEKANQILEDEINRLEEIIKTQDWYHARQKLYEILENAEKNMPEILFLRRISLNLLLNLYWNYLNEEKREKITIDSLIALSTVNKIEQFKKEVMNWFDQITEKIKQQNQVYSEAVEKIIEYMEHNYNNTITLDILADYVHMNRSYVSHLFKKETGENINNMLIDIRIEKAKMLLLNSKDSIQNICEMVGIPDSAYFSKIFKKQVGISPLEFRKEK